MIGLSWSRWIADRSARVGGFDGGAVVGERRWAPVGRERIGGSALVSRLLVVRGFLVRHLVCLHVIRGRGFIDGCRRYVIESSTYQPASAGTGYCVYLVDSRLYRW